MEHKPQPISPKCPTSKLIRLVCIADFRRRPAHMAAVSDELARRAREERRAA